MTTVIILLAHAASVLKLQDGPMWKFLVSE